jgi:hypothetical protein
MGKKKNVVGWRQHWHQIEDKKKEDDYTNHFLSHFGFYDQNIVRYWTRYK